MNTLHVLPRALWILALLLASACGDGAPSGTTREPNASSLDSLRAEVARIGGELDGVAASLDAAGAGGASALAQRRLALFALLVAGLAALAVRGFEAVAARPDRAARFTRFLPLARLAVWALALAILLRLTFPPDGQAGVAVVLITGGVIGFAARGVVRDLGAGVGLARARPLRAGATPRPRAGGDSAGHPVVTELLLPVPMDGALAGRVARQVAASSRYVDLRTPITVRVRDSFRLEVRASVSDARHEGPFTSDLTARAHAELRRRGMIGGPPP